MTIPSFSALPATIFDAREGEKCLPVSLAEASRRAIQGDRPNSGAISDRLIGDSPGISQQKSSPKTMRLLNRRLIGDVTAKPADRLGGTQSRFAPCRIAKTFLAQAHGKGNHLQAVMTLLMRVSASPIVLQLCMFSSLCR